MIKVKISKEILLALILFFFFLSFSFAFGQERKLEVEYPKILNNPPPETVKTGLPEYAAYIFNLAIVSLGLVALAAMIWGGILYVTSAGNPAKQKEAKEQMASAFLGIIIILSSYILLTSINPQLVIFRIAEPKIAEVKFCETHDDCLKRYGQGYKCKDGLCVISEECSKNTDCPIGYFCDTEANQGKGQCVRKTEYSLIALEIPLGRMIDSGIWNQDTNKTIENWLNDFEAFLKREVEIEGQRFDSISNLNKTLKSLTDLCNCDAANAHCAVPQNQGAGISCSGHPCKDYKKKIDQIVAMNKKIIENTEETDEAFDGEVKKIDKIDSLIEFRRQLMGVYKVLINEEDRFFTAYNKFQECLQEGTILNRNQFLAQVEMIEEQGGKTKLLQIFPGITSSTTFTGVAPTLITARPDGTTGLTVRLTSYLPGFGKINGVDQGDMNTSFGGKAVTIRDFLTDPVKYPHVSIALPLQLYQQKIIKKKEVIRIPELEREYPGIKFKAVDTGEILTRRYNETGGQDIIVDVATFAKGQDRVANVDRPATLVKAGEIFTTAPLFSAGDPFTFYCIKGGSIIEPPRGVTPPSEILEKPEIPAEIPPEITKFEPLYCPAYIPTGELLNSIVPNAFQSRSELGELISAIDELIKAIKDMDEKVSDCTPANCIPECGYGPNPCFPGQGVCFRIPFGPKICCNPKSLPTCLPCFGATDLSPGLQTAGACKGKPEPPYRGSPCPRDEIEELAGSVTEPEKQGKIKEYEDAIFDLITELRKHLKEDASVIKSPIGDLNLFAAVRAGTNFCFSKIDLEKGEEPEWAMLECELALGNNGPDGNEIADCHPQSFFCCTTNKLKAAMAKIILPTSITRGATYYYQPPKPFVPDKPSQVYIKPPRPDAKSRALSRFLQCMAGKGYYAEKNVVDRTIKNCQPCGLPGYKKRQLGGKIGCVHMQYSDHYGCWCKDGCSYAADFPNADNLDEQCKVALAARACAHQTGIELRIILGGTEVSNRGEKCGDATYAEGHEGHIHVSIKQTQQCGCE